MSYISTSFQVAQREIGRHYYYYYCYCFTLSWIFTISYMKETILFIYNLASIVYLNCAACVMLPVIEKVS